MKKNKWILSIRFLLTVCAAYGWWGVLYPELTMTQDTYRIVMEDDAVQTEWEMIELEGDENIYEAILEADSSQVHFRSRLLVNIEALQKQGRGSNESGKE